MQKVWWRNPKFLPNVACRREYAFLAGQQGRVLLRDVQELTLRRGDYTTGRRSSPIPQLHCVGGTAKGQFEPEVVQCYNRGTDGVGVQWECKAELPAKFQFGKISVSCEGYDYPNGPYALAGSCGLKYELDYSSQGAGKHASHPPSASHKASGTDYAEIVGCVKFAVATYLVRLLSRYLETIRDRPGGNGSRARRRRHRRVGRGDRRRQAPVAPDASQRQSDTGSDDYSGPSPSSWSDSSGASTVSTTYDASERSTTSAFTLCFDAASATTTPVIRLSNSGRRSSQQ